VRNGRTLPTRSVDFFSWSKSTFTDHTTSKKMQPSKDWKVEATLTEVEIQVIWGKGTERAGTGEYNKFYPTKGYFACKVCRTPLYSAISKFNSGCGWPAFDKCYKGSVHTERDTTFGMMRVEITCFTCGGHLGHVFEKERLTPTNERHCVNSISVVYVDEEPPTGLEEAKVL